MPPPTRLAEALAKAHQWCTTTVKSNCDAADELAKHATNVTNCIVERAFRDEIFPYTNEDALMHQALEDLHSYLTFLNERRRATSWLLAAQEKDRVVQFNAGLDRALSLFTTTCGLSSNECLRSSNELVRSNTIQLDVLASTVKQLDGGVAEFRGTASTSGKQDTATYGQSFRQQNLVVSRSVLAQEEFIAAEFILTLLERSSLQDNPSTTNLSPIIDAF
ncbi:hypothetical protein C8J57DRAFT_1521564 [Mycena rebaudengoi]|nr:hypothetical protein C8J57DRAFT_1521564 [Mycena rebaudengoi]